MAPWVKKLAIILGIIASAFVISSSVKTWMDDKAAEEDGEEQACLLGDEF